MSADESMIYQYLLYCFYIIVAYLIGSLPTGYVITHIIAGVDVRRFGSGNIGATNVSRVLGTKFFFLVLLIDAFKAYAVLCFVQYMTSSESLLALCAVSVLIGNCFSLFLSGNGGKGVATLFGITCAISPFLAFYFAFTWALVYIITRISAISSLVASLSLPVVACYLSLSPWLFFSTAWLILVRHWNNIKAFLYKTY